MRAKNPEIIYEDPQVIVCRKEAGVPVQTSRAGQADLVNMLKTYRAKKREEPYVGLVHRLDQPVEGIMVFAKTKSAAAELSGQVRGRTMDKQYLAVVCGCMSGSRGELTDCLLRDGKTNTSAVVPEHTPGGKMAHLSYEVCRVDRERQLSLVKIMLDTGRHHQIRVQFAHAGYPLYADTKYGTPLPGGEYCPVALCSCKIGFLHPGTKKKMEFEIVPSGKGFAGMV